MKRILYLPLRKEWYEMIERGEKREEYRTISPYWMERLLKCSRLPPTADGRCINERCQGCPPANRSRFKEFDTVCFSYGYTLRRMAFECKGITVGHGRSEWGAPEHETFIIRLGKRTL